MGQTLRAMAIILLGLALSAEAAAQTTRPHDAAPATGPAEVEPADRPPQVQPEAQALLDQVRQAYARLASLELAGRYRLEVDAAGTKMEREAEFAASFKSPNRFKHEMTDDALLVGTGSKVYLYVPRTSRYVEAEPAAQRAEAAGLTDPLLTVLRAQNPSLYLALCADASAELLDEAESVEAVEPQEIDGARCLVLVIRQAEEDLRVMLDPQTHLIRRLEVDLSKSLRARDMPDVKVARVTVDYTHTRTDTALAEEQFTWSPPSHATPARSQMVAVAGAEPESLVGRRAPDFTLTDLDGKNVALSKLRGQVVVLDFWATWCGPCRQAMPHLQKLQDELGPAGVQVITVNLREEPEAIQQFLTENKLTLPVVLDRDGKVATQFGVSGIPHTVVVARNGTIRNVFVGFGPGSEQKLREAVQQANAVR